MAAAAAVTRKQASEQAKEVLSENEKSGTNHITTNDNYTANMSEIAAYEHACMHECSPSYECRLYSKVQYDDVDDS